MERPAQARTARVATLTCFVVLATFGLGGTFIFTFFGITIPAFKIAGGILLFGVGLEMMREKQSETRTTTEEKAEAEVKDDVAAIIEDEVAAIEAVEVEWPAEGDAIAVLLGRRLRVRRLDAGVRIDTDLGVFELTISNALGRVR